MKIADLKDKLPCRVKITTGYTLDESIDPGFVVDIVNIKPDTEYDKEKCYQFWFRIPPELIPICTEVALCDWYDDNRELTWNYFEANKQFNKNGTFESSGYVMENDDWFEFYEEPKSEFIQVKILQDESSHWYIVPSDLEDEFFLLSRMAEEGPSLDCMYTYQDFIQQFEDKFAKYRTGGDVNNYQLFISQDELKRLTQ